MPQVVGKEDHSHTTRAQEIVYLVATRERLRETLTEPRMRRSRSIGTDFFPALRAEQGRVRNRRLAATAHSVLRHTYRQTMMA
jgi:hypothetical protein